MIAHAASRFPARIWMRVDALEPLTCSVRFAMTMGFGRLTWGGADSRDIQPAVVAGTAAGLIAADLSALSRGGHACSDAAGGHGACRLPSQGRSRVGERVEIDVTTDNIDGPPTSSQPGLDGVESPADGLYIPVVRRKTPSGRRYRLPSPRVHHLSRLAAPRHIRDRAPRLQEFGRSVPPSHRGPSSSGRSSGGSVSRMRPSRLCVTRLRLCGLSLGWWPTDRRQAGRSTAARTEPHRRPAGCCLPAERCLAAPVVPCPRRSRFGWP